MTEIPQAAIDAAAEVIGGNHGCSPAAHQRDAKLILEAAAPHIRAAERAICDDEHHERTQQAVAAERERIAALADQHEARRVCLKCGSYGTSRHTDAAGPCCPADFSFASLLRKEDPDGR